MSVIIHRGSTEGFAMLPNTLLRDPKMSAKARGVLVTLLSHEDGWQQSATFTEREMTDGRDSIRSAIRELVGLGYIVRERRSRAGGRFQTDLHVYDTPKRADSPQSEQPTPESPTPDRPALELRTPDVEPQGEELGLTSVGRDLSASEPMRPTVYPIEFEEFWELVPVRRDKAKALAAWKKARRRADAATINAGMVRYAAWLERHPDTPAKYAEGWLNGDRWLDEDEPSTTDRAAAMLRARMGES